MPLDYVRDDAFSGVMKKIDMEKLLLVVGGLPNSKAAGLSSIPNKLGSELSIGFVECLLDGVFTNTHPIALIETARKILSKVLSNRIFFVCSKFNVLCGDNFSVLKGTSMQSLVFAVGVVVEDAFEKNRELWLASLWRIKMCNKFIRFFGSIHKSRFNRVMTDFGLSDGYYVCDGLNQSEVFSPFLWRIFYDPLLCEGSGGLSSYFTAGVFVDNTIWVGNCQAATQNILDIASEFFVVNDISINNEKTVTIPINQDVKIASLNISGLLISIAKKGETHCYLGIFLSTEGLSKLNVAKVHSDVRFFTNVVLKKTITDKQFLYLFSFVSLNVYNKWDVMLRKGLKSKAGLSCDFPSEALCHPSLYDLKSFEQMQSEGKLAALISFSNSFGVFEYMFEHRFLNLQVLRWSPLNPLQFSVRLCVSPINNFLVGMVKIFLCNELSLSNSLPNAFRNPGSFLVFFILGSSLYFNSKGCIMSWTTFRCWKRLGPRGPVLYWFMVVSDFFCSTGISLASFVESTCLFGVSILDSEEFSAIVSRLHKVWSNSFEVFMDGSLKNFGGADVVSGAMAFFSAIDMSIGIKIHGLLSSTMAELQAITLSLECVSSSCTVVVHTDSQVAIDACISEMSLSVPDFCSSCWLKRHQIFDLVHEKDLFVHWVKVKGHSGVVGNIKADTAAEDAVFSHLSLSVGVWKRFLVAENTPVSDNTHYFVQDLYRSVCHTRWEARSGRNVIPDVLIEAMDWDATVRLSVVVRKWLYDKLYPGVLCLLCHEVELLDHVFTCSHNVEVYKEVLVTASLDWLSVVSPHGSSSSAVLQSLGWCSLDVNLYSVLCKKFVLREWCMEAVKIFDGRKEAISAVVGFVGHLVELYCSKAWLARSAFKVRIKKAGLVGDDSLFSGLSRCLGSLLPNKVVRMLGIAGSFAINFSHCRSYLFFSGLDGNPSVNISM
ncbi:hypothetical protein G9A89_004861 [Geosiphon pyriformis]|nr:hypothetical protein G9A89_004861 [Geosiphon pyriformis]